MRCKACDKLLHEIEAKKKAPSGGGYYDMCTDCLYYLIKDMYGLADADDDQIIEFCDKFTFNS